jgi:glycosyltransferase involved in cell wall biosynthesis
MEKKSLSVSVIIPCRNEEKFIAKCLDSVILQDFPKEHLEILVIDGASQDRTPAIVKNYAKKYDFIKLLENPKKYTPFGLNIGLKTSRGEIIIRVDSHASYEKDYISKCVRYLREYKADNVGGIIKTLPAKDTPQAKAVAFCLSHFFGVASSFRRGSKKVMEADTVFGGCYKREVFEKIGYFNEKLTRSQDLEFNLRLKAAGGKIILAPDIVAFYYPSSDFGNFLAHNFKDGVWVTYPLKFGIRVFKLRHLIPLIFVLALVLTLIFSPFSFWSRLFFVLTFGSYLILNLFFSFGVALRHGLRYFFLMPIAFSSRHFGYGLGSVWGLVKIFI